jgi:hypothetical protein
VAGCAQRADGLVRVCAEGAAGAGDDLAVWGQLGKSVLELVERNRACAGYVPGLVLVAWADVQEHEVAAAQPFDQLVASDYLDIAAEVPVRGALDGGQARASWSTVRGACASRSSSSSRRGLANALPISAIASNSSSFPARPLTARPLGDPTYGASRPGR